MPLLELPSAHVNYEVVGDGPTLVLLHANPGDGRDFAGIVPILSEQFQVVIVDWPGYGESPLPPHPERASAMFFYQVFCELAEKLKLPPAIFIGNSVGGYVAARYAIEHPQQVRALVLVSPGGFTPHNLVTRAFCKFMGSPLAIPPDYLARLYLRGDNELTREMKMRAKYEQSTPGVKELSHAIWGSFTAPEHDLRQRAADIAQPTLLVFGKYDPLIPARKDGKVAAGLISQAEYHVMPSGHAPFAEMPQDFLDLLRHFLVKAVGA